MKKLEAIVEPFLLDGVKEALNDIGIDGITVSDVGGHGRENGHRQIYRGHESVVDVLPQIKIEMVVSDEQLEDVLLAVTRAARGGSIGDGRIFVSDVADVVRIRTGHRGEFAL